LQHKLKKQKNKTKQAFKKLFIIYFETFRTVFYSFSIAHETVLRQRKQLKY